MKTLFLLLVLILCTGCKHVSHTWFPGQEPGQEGITILEVEFE